MSNDEATVVREEKTEREQEADYSVLIYGH